MKNLAVVLAAVLLSSASISAKILMTFNDVKRETEYNSNMATLKDVLGENVRLVMADSDGNGVTGVKYQLYLNEKCALDGDEVKVGRERSVNINANENKEILIGNMDIPAEEFGCGPICLFAIADGDSKARARISKACDKGKIDLELVFDDSKLPNKRQSVDFDEDLSSKLNVLKNLKVKNKAGKDSPKRSKELKQSLTVAIRTNSITEEDVIHATHPCSDDYYQYSTTPGESESSSSTESYYGDVRLDPHTIYEEYKREMGVSKINYRNIPRCFNYGLLYKDLVVQDFMLSGPIKSKEEVDIDVSDVMLSSIKKQLCTAHEVTYDERSKEYYATLLVMVDALRLNNDSDLCNNYLSINISYTCDSDEIGTYDFEECSIRVNPLSRGHQAAIFMSGSPFVYFDGEAMERVYPYSCQEADYYLAMTEIARWRVLEKRLEKEIGEDESLCKDTEEEEASKEFQIRHAFQKSEKRKKRAAHKKNNKGNSVNDLIDIINGISNMKSEDMEDEDSLGELICNVNSMNFLYESLKDELSEEDEAHYQEVKEMIDEWRLAHQYEIQHVEDSLECDEVFDPLDILDSNPFTNKIREKVEKEKSEETDYDAMMEDFDQESILDEFSNHIKNKEGECPGSRTKVDFEQQMIELVDSNLDSKQSGEMHTGPVPASTCGQRRLQQVLESGAGGNVNKDLGWLKPGYSTADDEVNYNRVLQLLMEETSDESADIETIDGMLDLKEKVKTKLEEQLNEEKDSCSTNREEMVKKQYSKVENAYDVSWKIEDGIIHRGVSDVLSDSFGKVSGDRSVIWKPVATCTCRTCSNEYAMTPEHDYDYYDWRQWAYDSYGYMSYSGDYDSYEYGDYPNMERATFKKGK